MKQFSLTELLWLTTFIAGWLGSMRIAPGLAAIVLFVSIPAFIRTTSAVQHCKQAQVTLSRADQLALFLISQTVVIACIAIPVGCGIVVMWIGSAMEFYFGDSDLGAIWVFLGASLGLITALVAFIVTVWSLAPTLATPAPSRRLALASGLPVAFFAACSAMLYGEPPRTLLLPRLVAACLVISPLVNTLVWIIRRRQSGRPAYGKEIARTLLRGVASTIGTALAAATCAYIAWIGIYSMSAHEGRPPYPWYEPWRELCELLAPAAALSVGMMVTIYLVQYGFTKGCQESHWHST